MNLKQTAREIGEKWQEEREEHVLAFNELVVDITQALHAEREAGGREGAQQAMAAIQETLDELKGELSR